MKSKYGLVVVVVCTTVISLSFLCLSSCSKKQVPVPTEEEEQVLGDVDVYVLGNAYDENSGDVKPLYWKNGDPVVHLFEGAGYWINETDGAWLFHRMAVADNEVYLGGELTGYNGSLTVAGYWKDDSEVRLTDLDGYARGLAIDVADGNVYVAGTMETSNLATQALYWVNDDPVFLTHDESGNTFLADASAIAVSGNDVHVAGHIMGTPTYWKNGEAFSLPGQGIVTDIAVSDNGDVYISGYGSNGRQTVAKYWKNGEVVEVGTGERLSEAYGIAVDQDDVYVVGYERVDHGIGYVARYWKNGEAVNVTDGTYRAEGHAIAVHHGDVYVAGVAFGSGNQRSATYWKNGVAVQLSEEGHRGNAADIIVVPQTP